MGKLLIFFLLAATGLTLGATPYTIAVLPKGNYEFWRIIHAGAIRAQQELGQQGIEVKLLWEYPEHSEDSEAQAQIVTRLTGEKVSGFVLAPMNSRTLAPAVEAAARANIPTVVIDSNLRSDAQIAYVATENSTSGALAARTLGKLLGGKGRIVVFSYKKGAGASDARVANFVEVVKRLFPDIQVDADQYSASNLDSARQVGLQLAQQLNAEDVGIFCPNGPTTLGLLEGLQGIGGPNKMKVVGFDAVPKTVAALKKGELQGLLAQNPEKMGYLGVKTLVAHLRGEPFEKTTVTECVLITPDSINNPVVAPLVNPPMAP